MADPRAVPDALVAARTVLEGFEKGIFVRDISGDSTSDWAIKAFPYLRALGALQAWVDGPLGSVPAPEPALHWKTCPQCWAFPTVLSPRVCSVCDGTGEIAVRAAVPVGEPQPGKDSTP